jgi:hypothetical protein
MVSLTVALISQMAHSEITHSQTIQDIDSAPESKPLITEAHAKYLSGLTKAKRSDIPTRLTEIEEKFSKQYVFTLKIYLSGKLFYHKISRDAYHINELSTGVYDTIQLSTGIIRQIENISGFKNFPSNNKIRKHIIAIIARSDFDHENEIIRLKAVETALDDLTLITVTRLQARLLLDQNTRVREIIELALAIALLQDGVTPLTSQDDASLNDVSLDTAKLNAINFLSGQLHPAAKNALNKIVNTHTWPHLQPSRIRLFNKPPKKPLPISRANDSALLLLSSCFLV